jgi:tetratricopeptide (TPR) repeat protein
MMSSQARELDKLTYEEITRLCKNGDELANQHKYDDAVAEYNKSWKLIPEPKNDWEASTWILAAIADACFLMGKRKSARQALEYVMTCPGAIGNPFLHLRYGQILFDDGEEDIAADELMRAYMGAGIDIFAKDDPKYLAFLKTKAKI